MSNNNFNGYGNGINTNMQHPVQSVQHPVQSVQQPMQQPLNTQPTANPFAGIENETTPTQRGYIPAGNHVLKINSITSQSKRQAGAGSFFLAEMTIAATDNPAAVVGTPANFYQDYSWEGCLGRIKGLLAAVANVPEDQITQDLAMQYVGDQQPLAGYLVVCKAREGTNKKGEPRIYPDFFVYEAGSNSQ